MYNIVVLFFFTFTHTHTFNHKLKLMFGVQITMGDINTGLFLINACVRNVMCSFCYPSLSETVQMTLYHDPWFLFFILQTVEKSWFKPRDDTEIPAFQPKI